MPGTVAHQALLSIFQARMLEWVAIPFSGDLPNPGIKPGSAALKADSLPSELPGKSTVGTQYTLASCRMLYLYQRTQLACELQKTSFPDRDQIRLFIELKEWLEGRPPACPSWWVELSVGAPHHPVRPHLLPLELNM